MKWKQEIMYVMRNQAGVIIRCEEKPPKGFVPDDKLLKKTQAAVLVERMSSRRYGPIGD
ncbi:hypothetical protein [Paenibacillus planticolens]|uniref:hypothetical protein n=1 Tax=Paenibacillus planticolens TaxID=2654976 RepID=UPI0014927657|nr:hypothetical protein [Paenibacillus planticolens]